MFLFYFSLFIYYLMKINTFFLFIISNVKSERHFNLYKKRNPENLLKIQADEFLKDLLSDIHDRHLKEDFIFSMIILPLNLSLRILLLTRKYINCDTKKGK